MRKDHTANNDKDCASGKQSGSVPNCLVAYMVNRIVKPSDLHVLRTHPRCAARPVLLNAFTGSPTTAPRSSSTEVDRRPLPSEPRQTRLTGEELLHGGLLEVALFGDELVHRCDKRVNIRKRGGDGASFSYFRRHREYQALDLTSAYVGLRPLLEQFAQCNTKHARSHHHLDKLQRCGRWISYDQSTYALVHVCGSCLSVNPHFARGGTRHCDQYVPSTKEEVVRQVRQRMAYGVSNTCGTFLNVRNPNDRNSHVGEQLTSKGVSALKSYHST